MADRYPLTWALRSLALDNNVFEQVLSEAMDVFEPKRATALRKSSITMYGSFEARLRRLKLTTLAITAKAAATSLEFDEMWLYVMQWAPEVQESGEGQSAESLIAAAVAATQSLAMSSSDTRSHDKASPEDDAARTALRATAVGVCKDPVRVQRLQLHNISRPPITSTSSMRSFSRRRMQTYVSSSSPPSTTTTTPSREQSPRST